MFNTNKTVASVLSAFRKTIKDLKQVEEMSLAEAERQRLIAQDAIEIEARAKTEADQARRVAGRLETLISLELEPAVINEAEVPA